MLKKNNFFKVKLKDLRTILPYVNDLTKGSIPTLTFDYIKENLKEAINIKIKEKEEAIKENEKEEALKERRLPTRPRSIQKKQHTSGSKKTRKNERYNNKID